MRLQGEVEAYTSFGPFTPTARPRAPVLLYYSTTNKYTVLKKPITKL